MYNLELTGNLTKSQLHIIASSVSEMRDTPILVHKVIGVSEQGATLHSYRGSEGDDTCEASLCLKRELLCAMPC